MKRRMLLPAGMLLMAAFAPVAHAHHSHPNFYDECKPVTMEGVIESVEFKDPHTLIRLRLDDGAGFLVDWAGLRGLTNSGVLGPAQKSLVPGVRVVVTGNPIRSTAEIRQRSPTFTGEVSSNIIDPMSIRRVGDTFSWALPPRTSPMSCGGK